MILDIDDVNDSLKGWGFDVLPVRKWSLNTSSAEGLKSSYQSLKNVYANHVAAQKKKNGKNPELAGHWDWKISDALVAEIIALM
ncbi:MAG: hypothetical protein HQK81_04820 [Desulfovibrionaceae bacterium]|nr:hypothetical protein [Desulfovibrionaceae bacterium]MBF0513368.1 hypothetical protein [Desulfovibrionaceae bacterium]